MILHVPRGYLTNRGAKMWRRLAKKFPHLEQGDEMRFILYVEATMDYFDERAEAEKMEAGPERDAKRKTLRAMRMNLDKMIDQLGAKTKTRTAATAADDDGFAGGLAGLD